MCRDPETPAQFRQSVWPGHTWALLLICCLAIRAYAGSQTQVNFDSGTNPPRIVVLSGTASRTWSLPKGITFSNANSFAMTSDGRASTSQYIVLQNRKAIKDTVSALTSGLVLIR